MWSGALSASITNPTYLQIFNKDDFSVTPRVVISLVGLILSQQYISSIGLLPTLSNLTKTNFSLSLTTTG
jgi:hypothetical protein